MKKRFFSLLIFVVCLFLFTLSVYADYSEGYLYYTISGESITITGCFGQNEELTVPSRIGAYPVNTIASGAFVGNTYLKAVYLPDTIMSVQEGAFGASVSVYNSNGETVEPVSTPVIYEEQKENGETVPEEKETYNETAYEEPSVNYYPTYAEDYQEIEVTVFDTLEEEFSEPTPTPSPSPSPSPTPSPTPSPEVTEEVTEDVPEEESSSAAIIIIIAAVVVIGAAAVIIAKKKKAQ